MNEVIAMSQVRDIMQKKVITIELQRTVQDAAVILKEKDISFLVVVKDCKPVGVISERDIIRKVVAERIESKFHTTRSQLCQKNFKGVEPNTSIESAVQKMLNSNIRRLVVLVDENLAGVITQTDLTEFLRSKILINATLKNIESY